MNADLRPALGIAVWVAGVGHLQASPSQLLRLILGKTRRNETESESYRGSFIVIYHGDGKSHDGVTVGARDAAGPKTSTVICQVAAIGGSQSGKD